MSAASPEPSPEAGAGGAIPGPPEDEQLPPLNPHHGATIHADHPLSVELIDPEAVKIVRRLRKFGHEGYLVGGCVRDLLLGIAPKDFDVATSATPREIRSMFRNCRVIGRRFRLCHIFFKEKIIEVATFRTEPLARLEEDAPRAAEQAARAQPAVVAPPPPSARSGVRERAPDPTNEPPRGAAPAADVRPGARSDGRVHFFTGAGDEDVAGFGAGILETVRPAPPPGDPASGITAPGAPLRVEGRVEATPPRSDSELAPWEEDEEAIARERVAVAGRRARAIEEVAEAAEEVEENEAAVDRDLVDEVFRDIAPEPHGSDDRAPDEDRETREGGAGGRQDRRARDRRPRPGEDPGPRHRRRARWEKLLDEEPPQGYGTADEDARLRDFTINALFYDVLLDRIIDYVGGKRDLDARLIRVIGDPEKRIVEDPVRILRAIKQAARLRLSFDPPTWDAMARHSPTLASCSERRLLEEILKLLACGASAEAFRISARAGALAVVLPELAPHLDRPDAPAYRYLAALDALPRESAVPEVLVATLFYAPVREAWAAARLGRPGEPEPQHPARESRAEEIADAAMRDFAARHSLSKRTRALATRIILAQRLLRRPRGRRMRAARLVSRDWFDAAIALLRIAIAAEGADPEVLDSWTHRARAVRAGEEEPEELPPLETLDARAPRGGPPRRSAMVDEAGLLGEPEAPRRRRRRRGGRGRRRRAGEAAPGGPSRPDDGGDAPSPDRDADRDGPESEPEPPLYGSLPPPEM